MLEIGIVGDVPVEHRHFAATEEALEHAGRALGLDVKPRWHPTTDLSRPGGAETMKRYRALVAAPWSPNRSQEGTLAAIRTAREGLTPFLAACGGMQHAVLEFARNVVGIRDAEHAEYDARRGTQVVSTLACSLVGKTVAVRLKEGSLARAVYGRDEVVEKTTCNYGLNPAFQGAMEDAGFVISGTDGTSEARVMELRGHPFYVATLYVPQLTSTPECPHPLMVALLRAATTARE